MSERLSGKRKKKPRKYFHHFLIVMFAIREIVLFPALAAYLVVCLLGVVGLKEWLSPAGWFIAAPALYCLWVLIYLCLCAVHMQGLFWGYSKPRRAVLVEGARIRSLTFACRSVTHVAMSCGRCR